MSGLMCPIVVGSADPASRASKVPTCLVSHHKPDSETFISLSWLPVNRINLETDSRSKHRLSSFVKSS